MEIWLENCPFSRGNESIDGIPYNRSSGVRSVNKNGTLTEVGCTVHSYAGNKFYVDEDGILVAYENSHGRSGLRMLFQRQADGSIWVQPEHSNGLFARKEYVVTIGQPYVMPPELTPTSDKETYSPPQENLQNASRRKAHQIERKKDRIEIWHETPQECYLALADALYRPRVDMKQHRLLQQNKPVTQIVCTIDVPFFIPGKTRLFIEQEEKLVKNSMDINMTVTEDNRALTKEEIDKLQIGPTRFKIEKLADDLTEARDLIIRTRVDLYGNGNVQLPYEEKFDDSHTETTGGKRWICYSTNS